MLQEFYGCLNQLFYSQMRKDDELVCFRDLKPGARHHYLVVPRTHVGNCKSLRKEHIPLVEKMEEMGRSVLQKKKVTDLDDIRMGFHMPPFSSIPHLHLHVIAPASQMSIRSLRNYGPQSYWFITVSGAATYTISLWVVLHVCFMFTIFRSLCVK
uniref:HIT domain-containing protein n=1 Tax=Oncorhynchus kisutch TaxID=8019 RepID=A0A8C7G2F7_ONCKI